MAGPYTTDALRLTELLSARLCHEFAGPVGTLAGMLELAVEEDDRGALADALALAHEQAGLLATRLRLLRAAWGGPGEAMGVAGLQALLPGLPGAGRVRVDLTQLDAGPGFPPLMARLLLNVLLLAAEALPRGGRVALVSMPDGGIEVLLGGERAAWPPGLAEMLAAMPATGEAPLVAADARHLQAPLTLLMARAAGVGMTLPVASGGRDAPPLVIGCGGR